MPLSNKLPMYSAQELTAAAGVNVRTLRYYIAEGLLPGPSTRGKNARYTPEHLWRLLLIRQLSGQHVPLAQVRERLARMTGSEVRRLVEVERPGRRSPRAYLEDLLARARTASPVVRPEPADTWRRIVLKPGLEIHVRADAEQRYRALLGKLRRDAEL